VRAPDPLDAGTLTVRLSLSGWKEPVRDSKIDIPIPASWWSPVPQQ
jgi:hypothetical protein